MTPPRPTTSDAAIITAAIDRIYPRVADWFASNGDATMDDEDIKEIRDQLFHVIKNSTDDDGYSLAKSLDDDYSWRSDSALVRILDGFSGITSAEADAAVKSWAAENAITPQFAVGARVTWTPRFDARKHGTIVRIKHESASYVVQEDGRRYPKPHPIKDAAGNVSEFAFGTIIPFENVSSAVPPPLA